MRVHAPHRAAARSQVEADEEAIAELKDAVG